MRISDWSSDVCSSDLLGDGAADRAVRDQGQQFSAFLRPDRPVLQALAQTLERTVKLRQQPVGRSLAHLALALLLDSRALGQQRLAPAGGGGSAGQRAGIICAKIGCEPFRERVGTPVEIV